MCPKGIFTKICVYGGFKICSSTGVYDYLLPLPFLRRKSYKKALLYKSPVANKVQLQLASPGTRQSILVGLASQPHFPPVFFRVGEGARRGRE